LKSVCCKIGIKEIDKSVVEVDIDILNSGFGTGIKLIKIRSKHEILSKFAKFVKNDDGIDKYIYQLLYWSAQMQLF